VIRITGTVHEDEYTFLIMSRSVLLRIRDLEEEKVVEKTKTHFLCSIFFSPENRAVYEIMWNNVVDPDRPQMTI